MGQVTFECKKRLDLGNGMAFQQRGSVSVAMVAALFAPIWLCLVGCASQESGDRELPELDNLRLNQVQYIGTHNSYKLHPDAFMMAALIANDPAKSGNDIDASRSKALAYGHLPLETQLALGIRLFELDLHLSAPDAPIDLRAQYKKQFGSELPPEGGVLPGPAAGNETFVFHTLEDDFRSSCSNLTQCLLTFRNWSKVNANHLPVIVYIEAKYEPGCGINSDGECSAIAFSQPKFDRAAWERIEKTARSMIGEGAIFRPSQLVASSSTLKEAIQQNGWPKIGDLRGKFLFIVAAADDTAKDEYAKIQDPLFFTFREMEHPDASFVIEFDPFSADLDEIIASGLIASTYADYRLVEAREDDVRKRNRLFEAGAQMISTDFPIRDARFSDYRVVFGYEDYVRASPLIGEDQ